jgi:hypothetical protein
MALFRPDYIQIIPLGEGFNRLVLDGYSPYREAGGLIPASIPRDSIDSPEPRKCISLANPPGLVSKGQ